MKGTKVQNPRLNRWSMNINLIFICAQNGWTLLKSNETFFIGHQGLLKQGQYLAIIIVIQQLLQLLPGKSVI